MKNGATLSRAAADFSQRCIRGGFNFRGCGISAARMLKAMRTAPLVPERVHDPKARHGVAVIIPGNGSGALGALIRNGLARFLRDEDCYAITPKGETWLTELEIHGLLNAEAGICAPQEVAA